MKRTIEIDDTLQETIDAARADLAEAYKEFRKDSPDTDLDGWEPHDQIFDIADSATPVYTSEIKGLWYLYSDRFEEAYESAGIGDGKEDNYQQVAIFCYIEQDLWDYARDLAKDGAEAYDEAESQQV